MMNNENILIGMKQITGYLKVSEKVVRRWMATDNKIPIAKDGQLISHAQELDSWCRERVTRKQRQAVKYKQ